MADWLLNLPLLWMAVVVFAATYLLTASIYWVVTRLAVDDRARAFKALSPGLLSPLGILFALLVGFIAVEVWGNFDKAKAAVATEASALRAVVVLAGTFPTEQKTHIYALFDRHIEVAVNKVRPAIARHRRPLECAQGSDRDLYYTLSLEPANASRRSHSLRWWKRSVRRWMRGATALSSANPLSARLNRPILLIGLFAFVAIAMVHSDNRLTCAMALTLFASGIALSLCSSPLTVGHLQVKFPSDRIFLSRSLSANLGRVFSP